MGRPKREDSRASVLDRLAVGGEHTQDFEVGALADLPTVKRSAIKLWGNAARSLPGRTYTCKTQAMHDRHLGLWVSLTIKRLA